VTTILLVKKTGTPADRIEWRRGPEKKRRIAKRLCGTPKKLGRARRMNGEANPSDKIKTVCELGGVSHVPAQGRRQGPIHLDQKKKKRRDNIEITARTLGGDYQQPKSAR